MPAEICLAKCLTDPGSWGMNTVLPDELAATSFIVSKYCVVMIISITSFEEISSMPDVNNFTDAESPSTSACLCLDKP